MKLASFLIIIHLFGWKCGNSKASLGGFAMKNFVFYYAVSNATKEEMKILEVRTASPAIANVTDEEIWMLIYNSDTMLLNYSIVNMAQPENFTSISLEKNYTVDFFHNLLQQFNTTNKDKKLSLKKLQKTLQMCPPFSGVSVLTNLEPDDGNVLPDVLEIIRNKSLEVIISPFNSSTIKSSPVGFRYYHPFEDINQVYKQINNETSYEHYGDYIKRILNEFVYFNAKTGPFDTSIIMIFDFVRLYRLCDIKSDSQKELKFFLKELHNNSQIYSYKDHSARIKKFLMISCGYADDEIPLIEIDLTKCHNYQYLKKMIEKLHRKAEITSFSLRSLVEGLELSLPNGLIFIYAATDPEHTELLPAALKLIRDKNITVQIAFGISEAFPPPDPGIVFRQINEASFRNRLIAT